MPIKFNITRNEALIQGLKAGLWYRSDEVNTKELMDLTIKAAKMYLDITDTILSSDDHLDLDKLQAVTAGIAVASSLVYNGLNPPPAVEHKLGKLTDHVYRLFTDGCEDPDCAGCKEKAAIVAELKRLGVEIPEKPWLINPPKSEELASATLLAAEKEKHDAEVAAKKKEKEKEEAEARNVPSATA